MEARRTQRRVIRAVQHLVLSGLLRKTERTGAPRSGARGSRNGSLTTLPLPI